MPGRQTDTAAAALAELGERLDLVNAERAAIIDLIDGIERGNVAWPMRSTRTVLTRCDDWRAGRLPVGQVRP